MGQHIQYKAQPDVPQKSEGVTPGHYALLRPDGMSFLMLLALAGSKFEEDGKSLVHWAEAYELPEVQRFIEGVSGLSRHAQLMASGTWRASSTGCSMTRTLKSSGRASTIWCGGTGRRAGWGSPRGRPRANVDGHAAEAVWPWNARAFSKRSTPRSKRCWSV